MIVNGGTNVCGIPIGILCLETYYPKLPGHIRNASTFRFPVTYAVIPDATPARVVNEADPALLGPFIDAARRLEQEGVLAITGSCGFLALFQDELAEAVNIPVYLSSLIQIPMVYRMLQRNQKVGVLTASKEKLTRAYFKAVAAEAVPICVAGMDGREEFGDVVIKGIRRQLDVDRLSDEVLAVVGDLAAANPEMGALVIECTDLTAFAHRIQQKCRVPVFDIVTLTNMVYETLVRTEYQGIMPPFSQAGS